MSAEKVEKTVFVPLSDDELIERARTLAAKVQHVGMLRDKKRDDAKNTQALIDMELDEVERLSRTILDDEEERRQGVLFVNDKPTAVKTLAAVAAVVEPEPEFVCEWCLGDGVIEKKATYRRAAGLYRDDEGRSVCPKCHAQAVADGIWVAGEGEIVKAADPADSKTQHERISALESGDTQREEPPAELSNPYESVPDKFSEDEEALADEDLAPFSGEGVATSKD